MTSLPVPVYVTLRWVPGTSSSVQFVQWGRTFKADLREILFADPQGIAPLYLLGRVRVCLSSIALSRTEQEIYDGLQAGAGQPADQPADQPQPAVLKA